MKDNDIEKDNQKFLSFTVKANRHSPFLAAEGAIKFSANSEAERKSTESIKAIQAQIIFDTTRKDTAITQEMFVKLLQLSEGNITINQTNEILIDLIMPGNIVISGIPIHFFESNTIIKCDMVIGMDIINQGQLNISGIDNTTVYTFKLPIQQQKNKPGPRLVPKKSRVVPATRNARCPCGSGKLHKNCCAKLQ